MEVHDILPKSGNFMYWTVEKKRLFLTNQLPFFVFPVGFSCSLQTPTIPRVFSEGFAGASNYRCNCIRSLIFPPTTLCLVNELLSNHSRDVTKPLWIWEKRVSQQEGEAVEMTAFVVLPGNSKVQTRSSRCSANSCAQHTWSQRSWEERERGR